MKIDPNFVLDEDEVRKRLEGLEKQLAPFRTKVSGETLFRVLD